jgi:hypothetical protein
MLRWKEPSGMAVSWQLLVAGGGLLTTVASSVAWWKYRSAQRRAIETQRVEESVPKTREGLLVSALAVEIVTDHTEKNPTAKAPEWLNDLTHQLDKIVVSADLKPAGAFQTTYMVVGTDERIAQLSLQRLAKVALELKDQVMLFATQRDLQVWAKFGVHADIVPTVGLGSTVALSQLWGQALQLADTAEANAIELSLQAAEWLGTDFDIKQMSGRPVLSGSKTTAA